MWSSNLLFLHPPVLHVFHEPGCFRVQVFWVRVQGLGPGFRSSPELLINLTVCNKIPIILINSLLWTSILEYFTHTLGHSVFTMRKISNKVITTLFLIPCILIFFHLGFFSRTFTIHRTAGEGGGDYFLSPLYHCRELTSAHSQQPDLNWESLISERKSLTTKLHALNRHNTARLQPQ